MAFRNSSKFDSIIEGMMDKLSSKKKWQKRYFVLNEHSLVYYPDKKKSPSKLRDVMSLENVSKVELVEVGTSKQKFFEVQITCGSNFPYPLRSSRKVEADKWLDALLDTLQEGKAQRASQGNVKTQQDMMMQVAMAMNMGLQMGMQNNNDQLAVLGAIQQSSLGHQNDLAGLQQTQQQPGDSDQLDHAGDYAGGDDFATEGVSDAMDEVDTAIQKGSSKAKLAVEQALKEANILAECEDDGDDDTSQPTPAELAQDAGVDLTNSFANFYNDAFGDYDCEVDGEESDDDPFEQPNQEQIKTKVQPNVVCEEQQAAINP
jgi:hypothetical protein